MKIHRPFLLPCSELSPDAGLVLVNLYGTAFLNAPESGGSRLAPAPGAPELFAYLTTKGIEWYLTTEVPAMVAYRELVGPDAWPLNFKFELVDRLAAILSLPVKVLIVYGHRHVAYPDISDKFPPVSSMELRAHPRVLIGRPTSIFELDAEAAYAHQFAHLTYNPTKSAASLVDLIPAQERAQHPEIFPPNAGQTPAAPSSPGSS